nr:RagB/SusD family nutrient uptake outer membrane protein [Bacteroidota bacterium]
MKKYNILIIILIATAFIFNACEKDWLNPAPENQLVVTDSTFVLPENATKFVNACYTNLLTWEESAFSWMGVASITSDDADKGSDPGDLGADKDQMDAITYTSTSLSVGEVWKGNYQGVSNCNQAIANVPKFEIAEDLKNRLIGEARFLRALYYFNLVRCYGEVPLVDKVLDAENPDDLDKANTRVPVDQIYTFIEEDLNYAISVLPAGYDASNIGRATKGAATGFLAKAKMYQQKWQEAYDLTEQIINGQVGNFALVPDYSTIWREIGENSTESLFEIQARIGLPVAAVQQYCSPQGVRGGQFSFVGIEGRDTSAVGGWGFNTPSEDLFNSYETGDVRKKATIISIGDTLFDQVIIVNAANQHYNYKSYVSKYLESYNGNDDRTNKNVRILRMGEIYLINAEAANELANTPKAQASMNAVRNRAGLGNTTAASQSDLRMAIWKERRWELAMEYDRFFDLIRQGRAGEVLRAQGKSFVDGKNEVFPIPQSEISASGNKLTQNPGY